MQKCRYKVLHLSHAHVIKRSRNLLGGVCRTQIPTLPSLVPIGIVEVQMYVFFRVSHDPIIKRSRDFEVEITLRQLTTLEIW